MGKNRNLAAKARRAAKQSREAAWMERSKDAILQAGNDRPIECATMVADNHHNIIVCPRGKHTPMEGRKGTKRHTSISRERKRKPPAIIAAWCGVRKPRLIKRIGMV